MAPRKPAVEKTPEEIAAEINAAAGAPNPTADQMKPDFLKSKDPSGADLDAAAQEQDAKDATAAKPAPKQKAVKPVGVPHRSVSYAEAHPYPDHATHAPGEKPEYHEE